MEKLTTKTFKEKVFDYAQKKEWSYKGDKPAIIDFYADWCGPCKTIAPILEELDAEFDDIDFYKVDTEAENELASAFGIQSIPSILFISMEGQPQMALGALSKETFKQAIGEVLFPKTPDALPEVEDKGEDKEESIVATPEQIKEMEEEGAKEIAKLVDKKIQEDLQTLSEEKEETK